MGRRWSLLIVLLACVPQCGAALTPPPKLPLRQRTAGLRVAAGAALGNLLQGFNTGVIAGALLFIVPEFQLESRPEITGMIASSTTMGAVLGTAASGRLSDSAGRQRTIAVSSALFLIGGSLMGWSPDTRTLIAGRFVGGIAAGIVSAVVPTYIAECAEPSQRGALATLPQFCVSSGILLSYVVGLAALLFGGSWRSMLGFSLIPAAAQTALVLSLPESPRWLLMQQKEEATALDALRKLRGTDDVAEELASMREGLARERARAAEAKSTDGADGGNSLLMLVQNAQARRALLVCGTLQLFQQFCGVNAIVYFTPQILKEAGVSALFLNWGVSTDVAAMLATVLAYLPKIPAVLFATYLIDKSRRSAAGFLDPQL